MGFGKWVLTEFSMQAPFQETLRLRQAGVKPSVPVKTSQGSCNGLSQSINSEHWTRATGFAQPTMGLSQSCTECTALGLG
jgi:hypothetical protein